MNQYQIIKSLGSGAAGKVFLAKDKINHEQYAIKEVNVESNEVLSQALKEVSNMKKLQHPNIVHYHNSFQEGSKLYIVMEYVDGGDLMSYISDRKNRFLTEEAILRIFIQITIGLRYLHEHKIVHRDLKPQNIFLTRVGVIKIGDFGVSRSLDRSSELMETKVGTPYYLSPEIWNNEPYTSQTDIWSLGCILYELCCLKKPFKATNINQLIVAIFNGNYEPITSRYTENLRNLVADMLNQNQSLRPTALQILQIPFITTRMQSMVLENQQKLNTVNIIAPNNIESNSKTAKLIKIKKKPKSSRKKKKKSIPPQIIDKTTILPLPDSAPPKWALKCLRKAKTISVKSPITDSKDNEPNDDDVKIQNEIEEDNDEEEEPLNEWDELRNSTIAIQNSLSQTMRLKSPKNLPLNIKDAQSESEEIEKSVKKKIGNNLFEQLFQHLQNESNGNSKMFVNLMEDQYPDEVIKVRRYLLLQELFIE